MTQLIAVYFYCHIYYYTLSPTNLAILLNAAFYPALVLLAFVCCSGRWVDDAGGWASLLCLENCVPSPVMMEGNIPGAENSQTTRAAVVLGGGGSCSQTPLS